MIKPVNRKSKSLKQPKREVNSNSTAYGLFTNLVVHMGLDYLFNKWVEHEFESSDIFI